MQFARPSAPRAQPIALAALVRDALAGLQAQVDDKNGKSYFYTVDSDGREVEGLPRV